MASHQYHTRSKTGSYLATFTEQERQPEVGKQIERQPSKIYGVPGAMKSVSEVSLNYGPNAVDGNLISGAGELLEGSDTLHAGPESSVAQSSESYRSTGVIPSSIHLNSVPSVSSGYHQRQLRVISSLPSSEGQHMQASGPCQTRSEGSLPSTHLQRNLVDHQQDVGYSASSMASQGYGITSPVASIQCRTGVEYLGNRPAMQSWSLPQLPVMSTQHSTSMYDGINRMTSNLSGLSNLGCPPNMQAAGDRLPSNMSGTSSQGCPPNLRAVGDKMEPKQQLPIFKGKGEWRVFWLQFERVARRYQWDSETTLDRLVSCLKEDALEYFAEQPYDVQHNLHMTVASFVRRFDDRRLPETYRAQLQTMKKNTSESLVEYAAKVRKQVSKAYPGIAGSRLIEDLTIEHLVGGLSDSTLMYDVLTKRPKTVEETLDLLQWHESCKGAMKKKVGVRKVGFSVDDEDLDEDVSTRRVGNKSYVTEDRMNQFGRELREGLLTDLKSTLSEQTKKRPVGRDAMWKQSKECYYCKELGHFSRECPVKRQERAENKTVTEGKAEAKELN